VNYYPLKARRGQRGYSLLEISITIGMLSLTLGSVALVGRSGEQLYMHESSHSELEAQTRRVVYRISRELMASGATTLSPDPLAPAGADGLVYQKAKGFDGAGVVWENPVSVGFRYARGEIDDGRDNNGNGLVDEGEIIWTRDPGTSSERVIVWAHLVREYLEGEVPNGVDDNGNGLVDERGISFERNGDILTIRVTLEGDGPGASLITHTGQTQIRLRN